MIIPTNTLYASVKAMPTPSLLQKILEAELQGWLP